LSQILLKESLFLEGLPFCGNRVGSTAPSPPPGVERVFLQNQDISLTLRVFFERVLKPCQERSPDVMVVPSPFPKQVFVFTSLFSFFFPWAHPAFGFDTPVRP